MMTDPIKTTLAIAIVATLSTPVQGAVHNSANGHGQALIYPFYIVEDGWSTLLSVTNTTTERKAVKMRIREARLGQEVILDFNIYLAPMDSWSASIYDPDGDDDGPAAVNTSDTSCTVPRIIDSFSLPVDPAGNSYVPFRTFELEDGRADADDFVSYDNEVRHGFVELIEMAEVIGDHAELIDEQSVAGCNALASSWAGGPWEDDAHIDTAPPMGGLIGTTTLLHAQNSQATSVPAEAIAGLLTASQHSRPGSDAPSIATGQLLEGFSTESVVIVDNSPLLTDWEQPMDAINAVLQHVGLRNGVLASATMGTEWVVTFPTRIGAHSTDEGISVRPPFVEAYGEVEVGRACENLTFCGSPHVANIYDAMGILVNPPKNNICFPSPPIARNLCSAVTRFKLSERSVFVGGRVESIILNEADVNGWMNLSLSDRAARTNLLDNPNQQGHVFYGLPAVGFQISTLLTDQIINQVLSNFGMMRRHSGNRRVCSSDCE